VSAGRLVTWAKASAGPRSGTSGKQPGNAARPGAVAEAAGPFRRTTPAGQQVLARVETTHRQGQAWTIPAHQLARAVYDRRQRAAVVARPTCLATQRRRTGEPGASRDPEREAPAARARSALVPGVVARPGTPRPCRPAPGALRAHPRGRLHRPRPGAPGRGCGPAPAPGPHWRVKHPPPARCLGRDEGTPCVRGRSGAHHRGAALAMPVATAPQDVCGAATWVGPWARPSRQDTRPFAADAGTTKAAKIATTPRSGVVCLLTTGDLRRVSPCRSRCVRRESP
jgi:hypothetical protein